MNQQPNGVSLSADTFRELMNRYDEKRAEWIARFGSDAGFDAWFTKQAIGR